jgi:hypothetical protein
MTFEQFITEIDTLWDEDREKEAVLLAQDHPEHYSRYMIECWGEDPEEDNDES